MSKFAIVLLLALTFHCSPEQQVQQSQPLPEVRGPILAAQDRDFLEKAAQGNNGEIAMGVLVHGRALTAEVTQFGDMLTTDHKAANAQLAAIAARKAIALPTSLGDHQAAFDDLVDRKGKPFDEEFIRIMLADHQEAARLYRSAATNLADPDLRTYAAATLPKIETHLAHAQSLAAMAEPRQEGTLPPTPDATQIPPRSPVRPKP